LGLIEASDQAAGVAHDEVCEVEVADGGESFADRAELALVNAAELLADQRAPATPASDRRSMANSLRRP
jgi:hypothetical protein